MIFISLSLWYWIDSVTSKPGKIMQTGVGFCDRAKEPPP